MNRMARSLEKMITIYVTTCNAQQSKTIAEELVSSGLAACVNIVPSITSVYKWNDKLCSDEEQLLVIKSIESRFEEVCSRVKSLHSYENPEIIAMPVAMASQAYRDWVIDHVTLKESS
jgi:periplasmic divalent cation tolerance protein